MFFMHNIIIKEQIVVRHRHGHKNHWFIKDYRYVVKQLYSVLNNARTR
jgi:hypothetical protein